MFLFSIGNWSQKAAESIKCDLSEQGLFGSVLKDSKQRLSLGLFPFSCVSRTSLVLDFGDIAFFNKITCDVCDRM